MNKITTLLFLTLSLAPVNSDSSVSDYTNVVDMPIEQYRAQLAGQNLIIQGIEFAVDGLPDWFLFLYRHVQIGNSAVVDFVEAAQQACEFYRGVIRRQNNGQEVSAYDHYIAWYLEENELSTGF